jgi:hypothetical protein
MSDESTKTAQTSRRDRAILALLENPTLEKAAEVVAVHPTLRRWLRQPDFHQALQQARHEAFSQSMRRLQQGANPAVVTLFRIMADAGTPASSRVRAAQCVLELCRNNIELEDIEVRWARLESLSSNGVPRQKT